MIKLIIRKLYMRKEKFITKSEIESFCRELKLDYSPVIRYLTHYKYLIRILRGIFYVMSVEERKFNKIGISYLDAISCALSIKRVSNWYFGLETALKLNNLTHEYFAVDTVISDVLFRAKPIGIMGHKIAFIKLKPALLKFGIIKGILPYSDTEKTILDFIYLRRRGRVKSIPLELLEKCTKTKFMQYANNYGNPVKQEAGELYGQK